MGNVWAKCCSSEEEDALRLGIPSSGHKSNEPLLTSALRVSSTLPTLQARRKDNKRTVRIESLSPTTVEIDEFETTSQSSDPLSGDASDIAATYVPADILNASTSTLTPSTSPRHTSGLRMLLTAGAANIQYENEIERKEDEELQQGQRGLRRVERLDSLHTVLRRDETEVMFAQAPVAAMKDSELPKGLTFAFLDDCPVSRANFLNTLKSTLAGSSESIIRGKTIEEARAFVGDVLLRKPDIVVLDQCLDYEAADGTCDSLRGTDIAKEIRLKGFEGCIVIQSGQESLKDDVDFEYVDGVTGKDRSFGALAMARMVAIARRKSKSSAGLSMPSSTHSSWNSRGESSFSFDVEDRELRKCMEESGLS